MATIYMGHGVVWNVILITVHRWRQKAGDTASTDKLSNSINIKYTQTADLNCRIH